jgi:multidrug efflux system outer membrane protein
MKNIVLTTLILLATLSSCMVGPKYFRPSFQSPKSWMADKSNINSLDTITNLKWFNIFKDTVLNNLISEALAHNYNLANAAIRIEQSRASYGIARADLLPSFGYSAKGELNNKAADGFNLLGTASWEIDFWGKLRRTKSSAYAQLLASEEGLKTVSTTLISDVATLYFQMRDLDNRLTIVLRTITTRTEYLTIINQRFKGGDVAELDMLQADQQLSVAKATAFNIKRQLSSAERSLNILLGQMPRSVPRGFENINQNDIPLIPAGLPSNLLEKRPDIRQAEYLLKAETEKIGVAQASRLPNVNLTGFLGYASADLSNLISDPSFVTNASAGILGPLFSFGANKRRVDIQRQATKIAANNYANIYLSALGEVENALVSVKTFTEEYQARRDQAASATKALMLSQQRYRSGYTDYLEVLVAENSLFDSELQASALKAQQLSSYISLYRSLGGGW